LWANIVELRLADNRRRQQQTMLTIAVGCMALVLVVLILTR
jgi:predicted nucleic acid-binding Zn ribbon protein